MPSLQLDDIDSLFTPQDYDYALPNLHLPNLTLKNKEPQIVNIVRHCIKTHIIADSGEHLIPLWLLNKIENHNNHEKNIYYQFNHQYQAPNPTQLTQQEYARLGEQNELTQCIVEINRRILGYKEDRSSLLGQLTLLCKSLYFNSIHGIGKEEQSGSTAELAIRSFFDYYITLNKE